MRGKLRINPKLRRMILFAGPYVFSLFSSFIYILMFSPKMFTTDFSNVIFVFFAAIGWSSQMLYGNREMYKVAYYLSVISIITPIVLFEILRIYPYEVYQGRIIIGMMIVGNLWLFVIYRNIRLKNKSGN